MRRRLGLALATAALLLICVPVANAAVYWHVRFDKIGRADTGGGPPNESFITGASGSGVASNGTFVFWGNSSALGRATVAGTNVNHSFAPIGPGCGVGAVAANATDAYFLAACASPSIRVIYRVPAAGGTAQPVSGVGSPSAAACGIAVDSTYLYWSDFNTIGRVPLAGGTAEPTWLTLAPGTERQVCGLAVDSQHIYFTISDTHHTGPTALGRVNVNGTSPNYSFIPNTNFFGGSANPSGVAVDATHVYWGNQMPGTTGFLNSSIGRADKSGGNVSHSFISPVTFPQGVAVDATGAGTDADADNVPDATDNCPSVANADQANADGDGQGDVCDPDDDNDGRADGADNCPTTANAGQENFEGDGQGDACDLDDDNDGVADSTDNCPRVASADQRDEDFDGLGKPCDSSDVAPPPPPMRIVFVDNSNPAFAAGGGSTPVRGRAAARPKRGTVFSYRLDEAGTMRIRVERAMPGRRSGGRCRKPSRRLRKKRACTRWVAQHTLFRESKAGVNRVAYTGRVRGKALRPGRHRAVFTATAPGFSRSAATIVAFRVVRR